MNTRIRLFLLAFVAFFFLPPTGIDAQEKPPVRVDHVKWEKDIVKFEQSDAQKPPPRDAILFVGSSSIVYWNTQKAFPDLVTINRGFGGSHLSDSVFYAPRIILKYEPKIIVVYAGDNDLAQGITPSQISSDFVELVKLVHSKLPQACILYIAIKPSTKRWELYSKQQEANAQVEAVCKKDTRLQYIDVVKPMLGSDGRPRKELLRDDGLHLNDKGYALWNAILKPLLQ